MKIQNESNKFHFEIGQETLRLLKGNTFLQ